MKGKVSHISVFGIIISIIAFVLLVSSVYWIGFRPPFEGIVALQLGVVLFISSILLFAVAELVYNSQYQTKLLIKSIEDKVE